MTAVELLSPGTGPHDPRWHELRRAGVTASEIAALLGLSPWQSPFSLYWSKANAWESSDNEFMSAGRHLEAPIANWWWHASQADLRYGAMLGAGLYAHPDRPWQLATPDRLLFEPCSASPFYGSLVALLEVKWVAQSWDGWGEPGTDEIPVYYRAQVLWQADVLSVDTVYLAALGPGGFRSYVVHVDERAEEDLRVMRGAAIEFMRQLAEAEAPDLDGHSATITALRKLHPDAGEGDTEVELDLAETYREARAERKHWDAVVSECEARIRAALGSEFNRAVCNGKLVASRSVFERTADDTDELHALDDGFPVTDRLNPGRAASYG